MKKFTVYFNLTLAMLFWGLTFIWTKQILVHYNPITIITLRLFISTVFLFILNFFLKQLQRIEKKDFWPFILLSFFQPFLYFICENYGLVYVSTTVTAVIISTIPLFTPFAGYLFFKEKISKYLIMGLIISFLGVLMVIVKNGLTFSAHPLGVVLLSIAVVSAIIYTALIYRFKDRYNVFSILFWQNFIGSIMFIPLFLITDLSSVLKTGFVSQMVIPMLLLAILGSSVAYIFYIKAIQEVGMTVANLFTNTIPIFTAVFAFFLLGERLSILNIAGILVVLGGVLLSQIKSSNKKSVETTH